jgi:hypothetical protein
MENTLTQTVAQEIVQDEEQVLQSAYDEAAQSMVAGKSDKQIQGLLLNNGFSNDMADSIIADLRGQFKEVNREAARKDMLHGALWCGGGLLVTGGTYAMASEGGSYVMTWGPVIFGGYQFLKGVFNSIKHS